MSIVVPEIPYRGIESFRYSDHPIFFARDRETRELVRLVVVYRGVFLYGESGSGKSSLVNAGLIPAVAAEGFRADRLRVQPRRGEELVVERLPISEDGAVFLPSSFANESDGSTQIVLPVDELRDRIVALPQEEHRPLLVFDQFEELITLFEEAREGDAREEALSLQRRIVDALGDVLRDGTLPVKLLFGFREDYLAKVKKLLDRHPELVSQSLRLTPPETGALTRIIRGPFEEHPGHFDHELSPALADRLSSAIERRSASGAISLSEVQIVCLRLWESGDPDELLERRHVRGILEDYLEESLERFPEELHGPAVALLSQMVTGSGARNVVSVDDLLDRVRRDEPDISEERLKRALDALEKETKLVRREQRHDLHLYEISSEFLVPWIGRKREERLKAREQAELGRQLAEQARQQRARLMFGFGIVGSILFVLGVAFGALAYYNGAEAERERKVALSQELALRAFALLDSQTDPRSRVDPHESVETAFRAYHSGETIEAEEALRAALVESRRRAVLRPSGGAILSAAFSPDGKLVVTAGVDGTTRLWRTATGLQEGGPLESQAAINSASFSPNGKFALTAGDDGVARLWDWTTWRRLASFRHGASVRSAAFSRDGRLVVTAGDDGRARIWQTTGQLLRSLPHSAPVLSATFSSDGKLVLTAGVDGDARLWGWDTGLLLRRFPHGALALSAAFSPDGRLVATAGESRIARIWNASTGTEIVALKHREDLTSADFSPDGKFVVTASLVDRTVQVWNVEGNHLLTLNGHADFCHDAAFSPDGRLIVSASQDGTARVWDAGTGRTAEQTHAVGRGRLTTAAFGTDGELFVTASEDGTAQIWDAATGSRAAVLSGHELPVLSATFSTDDALIATASEDGTARVWETASGSQLLRLPHVQAVQTAAFSPDARLVVTTTAGSGNAQVWDRATGQPVLTLEHATEVRSAVFSPDGRLVLTVERFATNLWDASRGLRLGSIEGNEPQNTAAFNPDGTRVVIAQEDGTATIYSIRDLGTPRLVTALLGHRGPVMSASFSTDGKFVATSSKDGEARVWEAQSGRVLNVLRGHRGPVNSAVFSPREGSTAVVLTAGDDGTARFFLCQACLDIDRLIGLGHWEPEFEATRD